MHPCVPASPECGADTCVTERHKILIRTDERYVSLRLTSANHGPLQCYSKGILLLYVD